MNLRHIGRASSSSETWRRRLALFLALLISGGNLIFPRVPILLMIMFLCLWDRGFRFSINRRIAPVLLLLGAILVATLVRQQGFDLMSALVRLANFAAGLMLLRMYLEAERDSLPGDLAALLKWLALQAVITVPLAVAVPFLFLPVDVNETIYNTLAGLFTYHVTLAESTTLPRPDGFFFEPGVFHIYLNIYLFLALFHFRRPWHALLALAAVLATQSTTGLLIAVVQLATYSFKLLRQGSLRKRLAMGTLAVAILVPMVVITWDNVVDKFVGESFGSSMARQYDLLTGLNVIAAHPFLGIGFEHDQYLKAAATLGFADTLLEERHTQDRGNTNGIVFLLYSLGIPLALPFLLGMFRQRFFAFPLLFGFLLFLSLAGESIIFTPFFIMIIFSSMLARARQAAAPFRAVRISEAR